MRRRKIITISVVVILAFSLIVNIGFLKSSQQLNLESLKWAVKSQFIKYEEIKNGKIKLITHKNGGMDYSEFLGKNQIQNQKELIRTIGPTFSIFGLAEGAGFAGLPKGLPKTIAKCATRLKLDENLYFTDEANFEGKKVYVFYQGDVTTNSLSGSLIPLNSCEIQGRYRVQKSVMSWILSEQVDTDLKLEQLPAHFAQNDQNNFVIVTRLGEICQLHNQKRNRAKLGCSKTVIGFSDSQKHTHFGVKSVLLEGTDLYIAYAINNKNCNRLEIKKLTLNQDSIDDQTVQLIYHSPGCFNSETTELNAVGGRMMFSDKTKKKITFSLGNAEIWTGLETIKPKKKYGNLLELDLQTNQVQVISSGHRNPQGICKFGSTLYSSEQGPDGGDELNLILQGQNYGWPSESYGMAYGEFVSDAVENRSFGSHNTYTKPLISWVPALAVGDLICPSNKIEGAWSKNFILATLKDNSLRRMVLDDGSIRVDERIPLGTRIRDILVDGEGRLLAFTDNASIIKMKLIDR